MLVPVKWWIFMILANSIVAEYQPVDRFCIQYGYIECVEFIVFNYDSTMEILFLIPQIRYLRIDGNDGIRKLKHIGEGIDEFVVANKYIMAAPRFIPSIAIATE